MLLLRLLLVILNETFNCTLLHCSCGYVLKPDIMFKDNYNPYDKKMLVNVDPMAVSLTVSIPPIE